MPCPQNPDQKGELELDAYQADHARGRADYRHARPYDPGPNPMTRGYSDGWMSALDESEATYGHELACHLSWTTGGVAAYERQQNTTTETNTVAQP